MMQKIEHILETLLYRSRWLLAPFYLGLVGLLVILLIKFFQKLIALLPQVLDYSTGDTIIAILTLIDLCLVANLLIIIIFSGYENFVSRLEPAEEHIDRPGWMGKVDFSSLKIKLIGSIMAISAIELLKAFMTVKTYTNEQLAWLVGIHLTFVVSGVLFAYMDKLTSDSKAK